LAPEAATVGLGGATEASIWSNLFPIDQVNPNWTSIPYGKPMVNQRFEVLDEFLNPCPVWVTGQLHIAGSGLAMGYWRNDEGTNKSFIVHPLTGERLYRTGDLGRYLPDGNLEILGRLDQQIKINGYRIELAEIEIALLQHPKVESAVVISDGSKQGKQRLIAFIVAASTAEPEVVELKLWLESKLPAYMVPSGFVLIDSIPLTANVKVDRGALEIPALQMSTTDLSEKEQDSSSLSSQLMHIVQDVLEVEHIEFKSNLLDHGIHSMAVIQVLNRVESKLGVRPTVMAFFKDLSISGLTNLCQSLVERTDIELSLSHSGQTAVVIDPQDREAFKANPSLPI
jgi:pyochelin synthetase